MNFTTQEIKRYSRHFAVERIGLAGQARLKQASILCIGAGGLGSSALPYLAACGVGRMGIIDDDVVELSNLQRQPIYNEKELGEHKVDIAKAKLQALNQTIEITTYRERLNALNALNYISQYDYILDCSDNFETRYLANDVCYAANKILISASLYQFTAQLLILKNNGQTPCYRCVYPEPPPADLVPHCAQAGILGTVPGVIGTLQAHEAIKTILNLQDENIFHQLILIDLFSLEIKKYALEKNKHCTLCSGKLKSAAPTIIAPAPVQCITIDKLPTYLNKGSILIDVREPWERALCVIPHSLSIPLRQLDMAQLEQNKFYIFYCKSGTRSAQAVRLAQHAGLQALSLQGGILAYLEQHSEQGITDY